jgi:hypothetical protein
MTLDKRIVAREAAYRLGDTQTSSVWLTKEGKNRALNLDKVLIKDESYENQ